MALINLIGTYGGSYANSTTSTQITTTNPTLAGDTFIVLLYVDATTFNNNLITSITDTQSNSYSNHYFLDGDTSADSKDIHVYMCFNAANSSGSNVTITVNHASLTNRVIQIMHYRGIDTTNGVNGAGINNGLVSNVWEQSGSGQFGGYSISGNVSRITSSKEVMIWQLGCVASVGSSGTVSGPTGNAKWTFVQNLATVGNFIQAKVSTIIDTSASSEFYQYSSTGYQKNLFGFTMSFVAADRDVTVGDISVAGATAVAKDPPYISINGPLMFLDVTMTARAKQRLHAVSVYGANGSRQSTSISPAYTASLLLNSTGSNNTNTSSNLLAGSGSFNSYVAGTGSRTGKIGYEHIGTTAKRAWQMYVSYAIPANTVPDRLDLVLTGASSSTSASYAIGLKPYDFTHSNTTSNWRTDAQWDALTYYYNLGQNWSSGGSYTWYAGTEITGVALNNAVFSGHMKFILGMNLSDVSTSTTDCHEDFTSGNATYHYYALGTSVSIGVDTATAEAEQVDPEVRIGWSENVSPLIVATAGALSTQDFIAGPNAMGATVDLVDPETTVSFSPTVVTARARHLGLCVSVVGPVGDIQSADLSASRSGYSTRTSTWSGIRTGFGGSTFQNDEANDDVGSAMGVTDNGSGTQFSNHQGMWAFTLPSPALASATLYLKSTTVIGAGTDPYPLHFKAINWNYTGGSSGGSNDYTMAVLDAATTVGSFVSTNYGNAVHNTSLSSLSSAVYNESGTYRFKIVGAYLLPVSQETGVEKIHTFWIDSAQGGKLAITYYDVGTSPTVIPHNEGVTAAALEATLSFVGLDVEVDVDAVSVTASSLNPEGAVSVDPPSMSALETGLAHTVSAEGNISVSSDLMIATASLPIASVTEASLTVEASKAQSAYSDGPTYADAQASPADAVYADSFPFLMVGQEWFSSPVYRNYMGFLEFDASSVLDTAYTTDIELNLVLASSNAITSTVEVYAYDFGSSIDTGDYRTPAHIGGMTLLGSTATSTAAGSATTIPLADGCVSVTSTTRFILVVSGYVDQIAPTDSNHVYYFASPANVTYDAPSLSFNYGRLDRIVTVNNAIAGSASALAADVVLALHVEVDVDLGSATAQALSVAISTEVVVSAPAQTATAEGLSSTVSGEATVSADCALAAAQALSATIEVHGSIDADAMLATAEGLDVDLALDNSIDSDVASSFAETGTPTVSINENNESTVAPATALVHAPTVTGDAIVTATTATSTATGLSATISVVFNLEVLSPMLVANAQALVPEISISEIINVDAAVATAEALEIGTSIGEENSSTTATATAAGLEADVSAGTAVYADAVVATAEGLAPTIGIADSVAADIATATVTALSVSIEIGEIQDTDMATATAEMPNVGISIAESNESTTASATASFLSVDFSTNASVSSDCMVVSAAGINPTVSTTSNVSIDVDPAAASVAALETAIQISDSNSTDAATATTEALAPTITISESNESTVATVTAAGLEATISYEWTVFVDLVTASVSALSVDVSINESNEIDLVIASAEMLSVGISVAEDNASTTAEASALFAAPEVTTAVAVDVPTMLATATAPEVDFDINENILADPATATVETTTVTIENGIAVSTATASASHLESAVHIDDSIAVDLADGYAGFLSIEHWIDEQNSADTALATAEMLAPTVGIGESNDVDPATATGTALIPAVTGDANVGVSVATVVATAPDASLHIAELNESDTATATVAALTTSVRGDANVSVDIATAQAQANSADISLGATQSSTVATATTSALNATQTIANTEDTDTALATVSALAPSISINEENEAPVATASAAMLSALLIIDDTINVDITTATASAATPGVSVNENNESTVATGLATALSVAISTEIVASAPTATATALVLTPVVSSGSTVSVDIASASALSLSPTASTTWNVNQTSPAAQASGDANDPSITTTWNVSTDGPTAMATASFVTPDLSLGVGIEAAMPTATASSFVPTTTVGYGPTIVTDESPNFGAMRLPSFLAQQQVELSPTKFFAGADMLAATTAYLALGFEIQQSVLYAPVGMSAQFRRVPMSVLTASRPVETLESPVTNETWHIEVVQDMES